MYRLPIVPESLLARWDPRWKFASIFGSALAIAALTHPETAFFATLFALGLLVLARLPFRWVCIRLGLLLGTTLPFLLILPLTLDNEAGYWQLGPIQLSARGVQAGLSVTFRCLAIGCLAMVLLGTTSWNHTLAAAYQLMVPGVLILITAMAYRYSVLLAEEFRLIRIAMRTRGFRMRFDRHSYTALGHSTGAILVRGAERAERVAAAMRCRGFHGRFHTICTDRTTISDIILSMFVIPIPISLLLWDLT